MQLAVVGTPTKGKQKGAFEWKQFPVSLSGDEIKAQCPEATGVWTIIPHFHSRQACLPDQGGTWQILTTLDSSSAKINGTRLPRKHLLEWAMNISNGLIPGSDDRTHPVDEFTTRQMEDFEDLIGFGVATFNDSGLLYRKPGVQLCLVLRKEPEGENTELLLCKFVPSDKPA